ncbi:hypothetical protein HZ326_3832 [Fusarium oxysporum f. sp. albedinis]|nr:hypothetical protein HZ326_3832 [Fusarium oxysporum f. sp. albedinis]
MMISTKKKTIPVYFVNSSNPCMNVAFPFASGIILVGSCVGSLIPRELNKPATALFCHLPLECRLLQTGLSIRSLT